MEAEAEAALESTASASPQLEKLMVEPRQSWFWMAILRSEWIALQMQISKAKSVYLIFFDDFVLIGLVANVSAVAEHFQRGRVKW